MYRIALVCEGPADREIIKAVLDYYLDDYLPMDIQPPKGRIGGDAGPFGGGWKGVRYWCQKEVKAQGGFNHTAILENADLLIIQVDADVAADKENGRNSACPPPTNSTDNVRGLILQWLGINKLPAKVITCIPCMASETWAFVALWPSDKILVSCNLPGATDTCVECRTDIKSLLNRKSPKGGNKLVVSKNGEFKNVPRGYNKIKGDITKGWDNVLKLCGEARHFDINLRKKLTCKQKNRKFATL